jgi:hypothetical protein
VFVHLAAKSFFIHSLKTGETRPPSLNRVQAMASQRRIIKPRISLASCALANSQSPTFRRRRPPDSIRFARTVWRSHDEGGEESVNRFDVHRFATFQVLRRMLRTTVSIDQLSISKRLILEM